MNVNRIIDTKPTMVKEKMISYEEKSVGSTAFFKCEACPYMALAEDDIKFHLFTVHPELAKTNGLADNIQIPCPGCSSVFDAEETLRTHLRNHHKMGIKDIKKMVKSLVQIALKNAKLKKEEKVDDPLPPSRQEADLKMPQVIEITPDIVTTNSNLPKGVAYISVEELNKMSTPNFEKKDPKEIIQEASINIVYTDDVSRSRYISVSEAGPSVPCNMIQMSSVPPDLISSIQPHGTTIIDNSKLSLPQPKENSLNLMHHNPPHILKPEELNNEEDVTIIQAKKETGITCTVNGCIISLKEEKNIEYHRKCHQNGKLTCPECARICPSVEVLHTHLWKVHSVDLEMPSCQECGYKTYKKYRLFNIHMKCHGMVKDHTCKTCSKSFKNHNQLSKHKLIHASRIVCSICQREFSNMRRLRIHVAAVHDKLKPFKCHHCDHTAARKEELKLHLRSHTGDKPYSCTECSYRCADHNALRRHKLKHSKEVVYKCKLCPYTTLQSTVFTAHLISNHPKANPACHRCPYCPFKSNKKDKYVRHLTTHADKEGIKLLIELNNSKKLSWTIPSEEEKTIEPLPAIEETIADAPKPVNEIPIEVFDCDSLSESIPQNYSKSFCAPPAIDAQQTVYENQATNMSKDNSSDCLMSEGSSNSLMDCRQFPQQMPLMTYENTQSNLHEYLSTSVPLEQTLNSSTGSLAPNHCAIASGISNNIMSNFPIRLPPRISLRNQIMLKPVDKIPLPMNKVTGPMITPTQLLVPSSSNSPVHHSLDDGAPRKKPKISVKSNLILKGPDQENMFHSQQKMAFRRLEDNQRFCLGSPVTFNNLISTKFMQLPPEPSLSESPNDMMPYPQETMLGEASTTPVDSEMTQNPQIFTFNQSMNVNAMTMLPPPGKIQTNDPSYIKLEATIKQNTQSPSLERMCTENLMSTNISREYKASPPLEDINKNMSEIKNELKSDFYMPLNNAETVPSNRLTVIDQYLIDNIMGEQYSGLLDIPGVVLQETPEAQSDVIEIDDNSVDNKLLPRYEMNMPFESLCHQAYDFYFLDNEVAANNANESVGEMSRMVTEVPIIAQKENLEVPEDSSCDFPNFIQGKKDPMMNTSVRLTTNKINVKNIELMKN